MKTCSNCGHTSHPPGKCLEPVKVPVCCNCPEIDDYGHWYCCGRPLPEMMACYCGMENRINETYREDNQ